MAEWNDILSDNDDQLTEEELLRYLSDEVSEEEKSAIETKINNSPFEVDALQGLSQLQSQENVTKHVSQLNLKLRQMTAKRPRRQKEKIKIYEWTILVILILLFVCVITFVVITLQNKGSLHVDVPFKNTPFSLLSII